MPMTSGGVVPRDEVAIVVVTYDSDDVLPGFLTSVHGAARRPVRVVVADNKAIDGGADSATGAIARSATRAEGSTIDYLPLPGNRGYGSAVNAAIARLDPAIAWVLVSNPDVVLGADSIERLIETGSSDDSIGSVGPVIREESGAVYPSARSVPSLRTGVGHALFGSVWPSNPWTRRYRRDDTTAAPVQRDAGWLSGACFLVRRTAFDEISGFDEAFFMYFEDVDLGYRLGKAGYRNVYEPAASVVHIGGTSTAGSSGDMIRAHHRSAERFVTTKYRGWWLWPVREVLRVGLRLRAQLAARRSR